jgi:hypothetical protein
MLEMFKKAWQYGKESNIPPCCRARFMLDLAVDLPYAPLQRVQRLMPRHVLADGVVPCELHLGWWILTGRPPVLPENRVRMGPCCDMRAVAELEGVRIVSKSIEVEGFEGPLYLNWLQVDGLDRITVYACPWCKAPL